MVELEVEALTDIDVKVASFGYLIKEFWFWHKMSELF